MKKSLNTNKARRIFKIAKHFGQRLNVSFYEIIALYLGLKKALRVQVQNADEPKRFARFFNLYYSICNYEQNQYKYNPKKKPKNNIISHLSYSEA
ncbi:MAG: hypothetical protein ACOCZQ_03915, partial [Nanoarchaeota archaeon]